VTDRTAAASEGAPGRERARLLAFALLATVFDGAELTLLSYFFPYLARDFHASLDALVAVNTLQGLVSLAGGFLFGPVGDRFGRRATLLVTVFVYGAATLGGAFVHSFALFAATRAVAGLGIGGEFGAAFAIFNEVWPARGRGVVGALVQNMFVVGIVFTTAVGYLATRAAGHPVPPAAWRGAYVAVGACTLAVWLGILLGMPESPLWRAYAAARRAGTLPESLRAAGRIPALFRGALLRTTLLGCAVATGVFYLNYSLLLYQPTLLVRVHHLGPAQLTEVLLLGYLALFGGSMAAGALADGAGRRVAAAALSAVGLAGYGVYLFTWRLPEAGSVWTWPLFWAVLGVNVGNGAIGTLGVWLGELYPTRLRATGENVVYYVGRGVGASVLPLLAIRLTGGAVGQALGLGAVGAALAAAVSPLLPETRGRAVHAVE
jgi:MFS family permease